jgi:hypothetical protein
MSEIQSTSKMYETIVSQPEAIVVHCSDPRFQKAFREFIRNELNLHEGEYIPLVVSGGVGSLSNPLKLPKEYKFMKERIEYFLRQFHSISTIILINHQDCRYYAELQNSFGSSFLFRVKDIIEKQKIDLHSVAENLRSIFSLKTDWKLYYAKFTDEKQNKVIFETVMIF